MAEDDDSEKTEDPTSKRLSKLREKGNVIKSQELTLFTSVLSLLIIVWFIIPMLANYLGEQLRLYFAGALDYGEINIQSLTKIYYLITSKLLVWVIPVGLLTIFMSLSTTLAQHGFLWVPSNLGFKFNKLNPIKGFNRTFNIFSTEKSIPLIINLLKISISGILVFLFLSKKVGSLPHFASVNVIFGLKFLHQNVVYVISIILLFMLVVAIADYSWQYYSFMKKNKMSLKEVKDEHKDSEGDPVIKGKIRAIRRQRFMDMMVNFTERADVVVTNPNHYAVALEYKPELMGAPVVVAKGQDLVALRIKKRAKENEIPVIENPPLARALYASCEIEDEIPPEHYKAVAEIISYIMKLKNKIFD